MIDEKISHYRILEIIGAGAMGEIYRAHDELLNRDVALKVLLSGATHMSGESRLLQEAQTASSLNHPHICTIYEVGQSEGRTFIAMELIKGRPLNVLTTTGGLPLQDALRYGTQIADALEHAHEHGVIHRDLKSANVMVTS